MMAKQAQQSFQNAQVWFAKAPKDLIEMVANTGFDAFRPATAYSRGTRVDIWFPTQPIELMGPRLALEPPPPPTSGGGQCLPRLDARHCQIDLFLGSAEPTPPFAHPILGWLRGRASTES
jgi:hypothetical protein